MKRKISKIILFILIVLSFFLLGYYFYFIAVLLCLLIWLFLIRCLIIEYYIRKRDNCSIYSEKGKQKIYYYNYLIDVLNFKWKRMK